MQFEGAVIREQGVTFAVVVVKRQTLEDRSQAQDAIQQFGPVFGGVPVVLMAQDSRGTPTYYGRRDLSRFLANVPMRAIPWKRYTLN
jgi:hypothetical protein